MKLDSIDLDKVWFKWPEIIDKCLNGHGNLLDLKFFCSSDDVKVVIIGRKAQREHCTVVALGVGGDIDAERQLQVKQPMCSFYGADPMLEWGRIYDETSRYFQVAVNDVASTYKASVKSGIGNGGYKFVDM